jgi:DNA polymerase I-like protein with 3'-5' exonuclease and polymerase domains
MLIFDIETNGLLEDTTQLHCMAVHDTATGKTIGFDPSTVQNGVRLLIDALAQGETIAGHNIIAFDIPALTKLYPNFIVSREQREQVLDTLILSRLIYSNLETTDLGLMRSGQLPSKLYKSHSLRAWGYRLGEYKGDYGAQENAWETYSPAMLDYCIQDVVVTAKLMERLMRAAYSERAIRLEHEVAWLMAQQERNGFPFDREGAERLERTLRERSAVLSAQLTAAVPPLPDKVFIPKRDNKRLGYVKGVPIQRYKDFNPNSRQQIEYVFRQMHQYHPDNPDLYDTPEDCDDFMQYRLKIDDETFRFIKDDATAPEGVRSLAAIMEESLLIGKRLGQLADGKNAWLDMVGEDGRIHGHVITNGTVSGRAAHASPNIAQVPAVGSPYGKECRALFHAGGWTQVGVDACGLELRCLAHYMSPYDGGAYGHIILNEDIHTANQHAAGLPERSQAKVFIYAWLYGAGDAKIGRIIKGDAADGKAIKRKFLKATPAIKSLRDAVQNTLVETDRGRIVRWKRHYLRGLDGRLLHVRSPHSALNLLLQSAGALICKKWIVLTEQRLVEQGLKHGWDGDFAFMAWIHDEFQCACRTPESAQLVLDTAQAAMRETQEYFGFRMQLDTEGKIGKNWADCH